MGWPAVPSQRTARHIRHRTGQRHTRHKGYQPGAIMLRCCASCVSYPTDASSCMQPPCLGFKQACSSKQQHALSPNSMQRVINTPLSAQAGPPKPPPTQLLLSDTPAARQSAPQTWACLAAAVLNAPTEECAQQMLPLPLLLNHRQSPTGERTHHHATPVYRWRWRPC